MFGSPDPPKLPPPPPADPLEPDFDALAQQRNDLERRRRSRATLRVDPAVPAPPDPMTGLRIP